MTRKEQILKAVEFDQAKAQDFAEAINTPNALDALLKGDE